MKIGSGMHRIFNAQMDINHRRLGGYLRMDGRGVRGGLARPQDSRWMRENADIMYTVNAREPKHYPEDLAEAAILFHVAGENWTVPSEGWEETSLAMFAGDWEACKIQVNSVYDAMRRLKPKRMVVTECGHAYRATVIEGPYWAGLKDGKTPVPSFHYVEWVAEALRTGKIKIDPSKKIKEPVTVQDSCNYIRNAGLRDCTREIMSYIAEDFREMSPNKEHNFCCGGGGGFNGLGRYREQRNIGLKSQEGPDSGHRGETGDRALPQLLGRHQGPGGSLQDRNQMELSQAASDPYAGRSRPFEAAGGIIRDATVRAAACPADFGNQREIRTPGLAAGEKRQRANQRP